MHNWKRSLLSAGGRDVLIKAVGAAIPIYSLACFKLPESLLDGLHRMMTSFWWGQRNRERKMAWISWDKICWRKGEGGLGFKDLKAMNLVLLAKQCWRLLTNQNSLFYKIFRSKYFRFGDVLSAELGNNPSWAWQSILEGRKVIEKGLCWKVGNDNNIKVYQDPWLPKEYPFKIPRDINQPANIFLVKNLIQGNGTWNVELIQSVFPPNVVNQILSISISGSQD